MTKWTSWTITERPQARAPSCKWCEDTGSWSGILQDLDGTRHEVFGIVCPDPNCRAGTEESRRREVARITALFESAGVPALYADSHLTDFHLNTQAKVRKALDDHKSIFITGAVGVGKTRLLAAIVRELAERGEPTLFLAVPDLLAEIKSTYDHSKYEQMTGHTERELVQGACKAKWLALDDLGAEMTTEWVRQTLFQIVNDRYNWCRPMLVTSNLTLGQLNVDDSGAAKLGARIASRLYEMSEVIAMRGDDRRERRQ